VGKVAKTVQPVFFNRELSRLSFNHRVLQEARDPSVPVLEKLKFLAIYSSNIDEFYRIRVSSLRSIARLNPKTIKKLDYEPPALIRRIGQLINKQQEELEDIYKRIILPELKAHDILILDEKSLDKAQAANVREYFDEHVVPRLRPMLVIKGRIAPFLKNNATYLLIKLLPKEGKRRRKVKRRAQYATLEIPTHHLPRFHVLPDREGHKCVIFLDDIMRFNLSKIFPGYDVAEAHAGTLSRDAELYIDDEFSGNLVQKIKRSIARRRIALPSRFEYDRGIPRRSLMYFVEALSLSKLDLMAVRRYHKFRDFFSFPDFGKKGLKYAPITHLNHPVLRLDRPVASQIAGKDHLLHLPYQTFDYLVKFLQQAADDPRVVSIKIILYRVAEPSKVVEALIRASRAGKEVTVFSEVKARFDELPNIQNAERMADAGINVLYSIPGLKVHAKLCLVTRKFGETLTRYCYMSTGNFNEATAKQYCDIGMFTSDQELCNEANQVFKMLHGAPSKRTFKHLVVAPFHLRDQMLALVDFEIRRVKAGKTGHIILKMNSLEDERLIRKLYEASQAGVKIQMIIRGICCLVPGVEGLSENITVVSIVDRFLEHARVFWFLHGGKEKLYLSSADWMTRNTLRRIEVAFPVRSADNIRVIKDLLDIQLADNTKARVINRTQSNPYKPSGLDLHRTQAESYQYLKNLAR
jgi:polyphosphate kinase